jgi:tetratricopeptide (TPR) repeat protein
MKGKRFFLLFCFAIVPSIWAQETEARVAFKQAFYTATTQKIIQNNKKALELFIDLCAKYPEEAGPAHEVAQLLAEKNPEMALPFAQQALRLQPKEPWFHYSVIGLLDKLNKKEEAAALKMGLFNLNQDFEQAVEAANWWIESNNRKQLSKWIAQFIQQPEYQSEAIRVELAQYRKLNNPKKYLKAVQKLYAKFPNEAVVLGSMAEAQGQLKNWKEAEALYRQLAQEHPNDIKVHFALAQALESQGLLDSAQASLGRGFQHPAVPLSVKIQVLQAILNSSEKKPHRQKQALHLGRILQMEHGAEPSTYSLLGDIYANEGLLDTAILWYRRHVEAAPPNQTVFYQLVRLELSKGQWKQALKTAEKMASLYPANAISYLYFGTALNKNSQFETALEQLKNGESYIPASEINWRLLLLYEKAISYAELHKYDRAKIEIGRGQDLVQFNGPLALLHIYLMLHEGAAESEIQAALNLYSEREGETEAVKAARYLLQAKKLSAEQVQESLNDALKTSGPDAVALEWIGDAFRHLGMNEQAKLAYMKALELNPILIGHLQDKVSSLSEIP